MSKPTVLEQKLLEVTAVKLMPCPAEAVFTLDQTEEIVKISLTFDKILAKEIEKLECKIEHIKGNDDIEDKIKCLRAELCSLKADAVDEAAINAKIECLNNEVEQLFKYDEHNTCIVTEIKKSLEHTQCELNLLEAKVDKFEERVAVNLLSQAEELDRVAKVNCAQSAKLKDLQEELCELKKLAARDQVKDVIEQIKCLERRLCAIENTEVHKELAEAIACLERRVSCLEKRVFRDERVDAILGMLSSFVTKEAIEELLCKIRHLEAKEYVDERVDQILKRLCLLEVKEIHDERVDKLICLIRALETKEDAEKLAKRLALLEAKEVHDQRVDLLLCELSKINHKLEQITVVNVNQAEQIRVLTCQNANQAHEINCLNEKITRNSLVLDNKIDVVERRELEDEKVDYNQNASLKFLQTEVMRLAQDVERLQKVNLAKPACHV